MIKIIMMILLLSPPLRPAQDPSAVKSSGDEAGITKEQAAKIIQELQMIRMLLQKGVDAKTTASPEEPETNPANTPERVLPTAAFAKNMIGRDKAPLTLVEFVDLQCSFCIQFHNEILPELRRKYIDTGKMKFAVLDFPLPSHVYAAQAAALARCAESQGKYWQVHDAFLGTPQVATADVMRKIANENQLDPNRLDQCLKNPETTAEIERQSSIGRDLGVYGTPTFLLGRSSTAGVAGQIIEGATSLETKIQELLKQQESGETPQAR